MILSVLDQSPIPEGSTAASALHNTLDLAELADRLGFHRYWVAEHHATPALACAAPEILIAAIAARTSRIRVGSGGVMLPHYSPLKVAETFSLLAGLHPERIDLGLGRAPGTDPMTMLALQRDRRHQAPDDFIEQLIELLALLEDKMPEGHPFTRLARTLPGRPERPEPWLLGSSPQSAIWAAELGLTDLDLSDLARHVPLASLRIIDLARALAIEPAVLIMSSTMITVLPATSRITSPVSCPGA